STRLRADAARMLQDHAAVMTRTETWAVLLTGYADQQGPAEYNRALAQRRAESVKQFLVELGVPETSVKVVAVGREAALCDDPGKECQQLNRRVHLEIRNIGPVAQVKIGPKSDDVATPQARTGGGRGPRAPGGRHSRRPPGAVMRYSPRPRRSTTDPHRLRGDLSWPFDSSDRTRWRRS